MKQVDQHDAVGKFRLVVKTVNLAPIFGNGGERKDIFKVEIKGE